MNVRISPNRLAGKGRSPDLDTGNLVQNLGPMVFLMFLPGSCKYLVVLFLILLVIHSFTCSIIHTFIHSKNIGLAPSMFRLCARYWTAAMNGGHGAAHDRAGLQGARGTCAQRINWLLVISSCS